MGSAHASAKKGRTGGSPPQSWQELARDWLPSLACVVVCLSALLGPENSVQTVMTLVAGVCALALATFALVTKQNRPVPAAIWWLALPAAVVTLSALFSQNVTVGLSGMFLSRRGAVLWIVTWAWAAVGAMFASTKGLRYLVRTLAILGGFAALLGIAQRLGLLATDYWWSPEPSAFFVDSNGFAQFLLISAGCAASWMFDTAKRTKSWASPSLLPSALSLALVLIGIIVSQSRGAWLAAIAGSVLLALLTVRTMSRKARAISLATYGVFLAVAVVAMLAVSYTAIQSPSSTFDTINTTLNYRPTIWRSALAHVSEKPLTGVGYGSFSTYYQWEPSGDQVGSVKALGTYDPHSVVLLWALAAGLPGLLALGVGVFAYIKALAPRLVSRMSLAAASLLSGVAAWALMQAAEITGLIAAPLAAMLAGMLLAGMVEQPKAASSRIALPAALMAVSALTVVVLSASALRYERAFMAIELQTQDDVYEVADLHDRCDDPRYIVITLDRLLGQSMTDPSLVLGTDVQMLADRLAEDAEWDVHAARLSFTAYQTPSVAHPDGNTSVARVVLDAGRTADPASDLWDYLGAELD